MNNWYTHPFFVAAMTWVGVCFLYALDWSYLINIDLSVGAIFFVISSISFLSASIIVFYVSLHDKRSYQPFPQQKMHTYLKSARRLYMVWIFGTVVEIAYSRGLPIIWTLTGDERTYFDFGIPSMHGFLNSLISALSLFAFFLYLMYGRRAHLLAALFVVVWGILVLSRQLVIMNIAQYVFLYLILHGKKLRLINVAKVLLILIICILGFGYLGDLRSGADNFLLLAQPTDNYPTAAPSGLLWVYMYFVTPLLNLLNTIETSCGCNSYLMANTISSLLPSVIRGEFVTVADSKGEIVTQAFNVSTAFADPFVDAGYFGVFVYTFIVAAVCCWYWFRKSWFHQIGYSILLQCLFFTVFYDLFISLPIITQFFWLWLLSYSSMCRPKNSFLAGRSTR